MQFTGLSAEQDWKCQTSRVWMQALLDVLYLLIPHLRFLSLFSATDECHLSHVFTMHCFEKLSFRDEAREFVQAFREAFRLVPFRR